MGAMVVWAREAAMVVGLRVSPRRENREAMVFFLLVGWLIEEGCVWL